MSLGDFTPNLFPIQEEMDKAYKDNPTPANQNLVGVYFPNNSISAYALRFEYYQSAGSYPFDFSESKSKTCLPSCCNQHYK